MRADPATAKRPKKNGCGKSEVTEIWSALIGAATAAVLSPLATLIFVTRRIDRRKAKVRALSLATAFEQYVVTCAHVLSDDEDFRRSDGHAGSRAKVVDAPEVPLDERSELIDFQTLSQALEFSFSVNKARRNIQNYWELTCDDEGCHNLCGQMVALLSKKAQDIAAALRDRNDLPALKLCHGSWDIEEYIATCASDAESFGSEWTKI